MAKYQITAGVITETWEASSVEAAILLQCHDAGYKTIADAADACGQTVEEFMDDHDVVELPDPRSLIASQVSP